MKTPSKKVSVIISCRNEGKFIGGCLDSLVNQNYPKDKLEILVINGASTDNTTEVARTYAQKYPFIKLLENPKKFTPFGNNIGIKNSNGDLIMICGSHSTYDPDYVSKSVNYSEEYKADNVGGVIKTIPSVNTLMAKAITLVLSSFFGAGNASFRIGTSKPIWADTVFGGCYRKEVFQKIGLYNENLIRSQDMEFNLRLKRARGKILLAPDIVSVYHPKPTLFGFFEHNIQDGIWAILPLKYGARLFRLRHLMPLFFTLGLLGSLLLSVWLSLFLYVFLFIIAVYLLTSLLFSIRIALDEENLALVPYLVMAFKARHFGYGLGSLIGLLRLVI